MWLIRTWLACSDLISHYSGLFNNPLADEIIDYKMLRATVTPHAYGTWHPMVTDSETRAGNQTNKAGQRHVALVSTHFDDTLGEVLIGIEHFFCW